ncbi:tryptophanyl-tRNA synthetase [Cryomyces antarcticus]
MFLTPTARRLARAQVRSIPLNKPISIVAEVLQPRRQSTAAASSTGNSPQTIFSGIQPTGVPHLGNYLGALQQWVKLQNGAAPDTTLLYSIVDLHAITVRENLAHRRRWKREMLATLLAIGLDPNRSIVYCQSEVPAHAELQWILGCDASYGYLSRMTQWKSKLDLPDNADPLDESSTMKLKAGLFNYPVLQAADILLHRATHVPVGQDQQQHLEFARRCANSFNSHYGRTLIPPQTLLSPAKRIMSLDRPSLKMSKSHVNPSSRILLTDSKSAIAKKVRAAVTDSILGVSYDPINRPGVSNLVDIMFYITSSDSDTGASTQHDLAHDLQDLSMRAFKERVTDAIDSHLAPMRERYEAIISDRGSLLTDAAAVGREKATASAVVTMERVREAVGLDMPWEFPRQP